MLEHITMKPAYVNPIDMPNDTVAPLVLPTAFLDTMDYMNDEENAINQLNDTYAEALLPFAVLLGIFCVIGVLGNVLVITIFSVSQEYRNTNFRVFVIGLGIIDLLSCITLMPAEILKTKQFFSFPNPTPCKVKCFVNVFTMNAAAFVLFVICVDRYRKVCQPLKRQLYPELVVRIIAFVLLVSLLMAIPAPIMCGIQKENLTRADNTTVEVQVCSAEEAYHHSLVRYVYKFGLSICLFIIALSFIVMYILIVKAIMRHRRQRANVDSIRFESSKPKLLVSEKGTENIYVRVQLVVCPNGCTEANHLLKIPAPDNGTLKLTCADTGMMRHQSNTSLTSTCSKSKFKLWRSGSDISFRSKALLERPISRMAARFPYKTLIWLTLTLIFIVTFFVHACLSFLTLKKYSFTPRNLMWYQIFFRLYFINHIINSVVYAVLDKRFKSSCKRLFVRLKKKILQC